MVVSQPNTRHRTVTFALPPNHVDKYSGAYCEATLNRDTTYILSAKWATVPQLRRPPIKPSRTSAQPLPTFNRFALLADDNIDNDEQPPTATAYSVLDHETGETLEHCQLRRLPKYKATWEKSYADEIGRLCQGVGQHPTMPNTQQVTGTNTMKPIMFQDIPIDCRSDVPHTRVVCEVRPTKADPNQTCITIGGNTINYTSDCGTKTGSLETVKLVINSTLSTPGTKYMTADLSNFYLNTILNRPEYARIQLSVIPQEVINEYKLEQYAHNGWVYYELSKGMYGLKQAGKLANDLLSERLFKHGYYQ